MFESIHRLKPAVVQTLSNMGSDAPVEFQQRDWTLIGNIVRVLKPFKEATLMLSKKDASISAAIPVTTLIITSLAKENPRDDRGVLGMKRGLRDNMETRFSGLEVQFHYSAATLLDSKFKHYFYRDPSTTERTRTYLVDKIVNDLKSGQDSDCNCQVRL